MPEMVFAGSREAQKRVELGREKMSKKLLSHVIKMGVAYTLISMTFSIDITRYYLRYYEYHRTLSMVLCYHFDMRFIETTTMGWLIS